MESALVRDLTSCFLKWPFCSSTEQTALVLSGFIAIMILCVGAWIWIPIGRRRKIEASPPEVPPSVAALEVSRNARWVRAYLAVWGEYPRDVCGAFPRLAAMLVIGLVDGVAALTVGFVLLTVLIGFLVGIWHAAPKLIAALPQMAWWVITVLPREIAAGARYAASASATYQLLAAAIATLFLVLFFKSQAWQLTRLWIRSKKERACLRIRVV